MRTNKVKKILSIVLVSVILAITMTTIVLAIVPKKLYNPMPSGYQAVELIKDKKNNIYVLPSADDTDLDKFEKQAQEINDKIVGLMQKSVQDNLLSSIFQGTGSYNYKVVSTTSQTMNTDVEDTTWIVFRYSKEQTLKFDNEEYIDTNSNRIDKTVKYTTVFMPIGTTDEFEECVMYLAKEDTKDTTKFSSTYQVKFLAHQKDIYNYIAGLDIFN